MLTLRYADTQQLSKGDFDAKIDIENAAVILPPEMKSFLEHSGVREAVSLYGVVSSFPSSIMAHCGWTIEETKAATAKLSAQLRGHVPDGLLDFDPSKTPRRAMGALPPTDSPFQIGYKVPPRKP